MVFSFKKLQKQKVAVPPPSRSRSSRIVKDTKAEKALLKKIKNSRSSSGAKYGLIIGDEGSILIYIVGKEVQSRNFIAHASVDNLKEFEAILAKNKKAPVYMVIDSMDQSFVQQSLPPISSLGVKKLIKRRLDRDLGDNVIKGYVLLERDVSGRRDWNFLMVSLENSPHLKLWFEFIEKIDNRLVGIYLLSVEVEHIVKNIDLAIGAPKKDKAHPGSRWKFFVTHNKVGGVRQVILRDGRIIFTRLTQPVGEVTPEVIAGNIEQEMSSTIEYMKRLSFNPQQGLDIYVVASHEINGLLDLSRIDAQNVHKFTPFEISEFFGITGAAQVSDQFGDVILTAFIACNKVHRLVLSLPSALKVNRINNVIKLERTVAGAMVLGMIGYGGFVGLEVMQKYSEIENLNQKKILQQRRVDDLNAEIKASGIDIKTVDENVSLYRKMGDEAQSPVAVISRLRAAIIESVSIKEVLWQSGSGAAASTAAPAQAPGTPGEKLDNISIILRFPEISNTEDAFKALAKKVMNDVRADFPEYKVVYSKLPDVLNKKSESGEISFDDKKPEKQIIEKTNLEATLLLTKLPADQVAIAQVAGQGVNPDTMLGYELAPGKPHRPGMIMPGNGAGAPPAAPAGADPR